MVRADLPITQGKEQRTKNLNSKLSNIQHYAVYVLHALSPPSAARCALGTVYENDQQLLLHAVIIMASHQVIVT